MNRILRCAGRFLMPAIVLLMCSCAGARKFAVMDATGVPRGELWDASVQVLGRYFPLENTDPQAGTITTGYGFVSGNSLLSPLPGMVLKPLAVRQKPYHFRWKAEALIEQVEGQPVLRLRVNKERDDSEFAREYQPEAYEIAPQRSYSSRETRRGGGQMWTDVGRDQEMERSLLREIRNRVLPAASRPATSPETP